MDPMEEDLEYFRQQYIRACRCGNTKRAAILKKRIAQMEDALIIYKLTRAPIKSLQKIEVSVLASADAEKYIKKIRNKFKGRRSL